MIESLLQAFLAVFALIGIITAIYFLLLAVLHVKGTAKYMLLVIPNNIERNEMECMLRGMHFRAAALGAETLVVDAGLNQELHTACAGLCRELGRMRLCAPEELHRLVSEKNGE